MGVHLDLKSTTGAQEEREELSPELQDLVIEKQVYPAVRQSGTSQGGARIQGANLSMNRPELNRAAASFGFVNFHPDAQGFLRYQPQFIEWGGHLYPSLDLQLLKAYLEAPSVTLTTQNDQIVQVQVGDRTIPTDRFGRFMVNFNGPANTH